MDLLVAYLIVTCDRNCEDEPELPDYFRSNSYIFLFDICANKYPDAGILLNWYPIKNN